MTDNNTTQYGSLNGETREWFLLDWRSLDGDELMWYRSNPWADRYVIENTKGVSKLRRLTGSGASFHSERIAEKDEQRLTRGTFCGFERLVIQMEDK